jgi:tetratricopeptide (TPR) repeat protein
MAHSLEAISGHLHDRTAVLFLGAGINFGTTAKDGTTFPLAADLANLIATKLLNDPYANLDLADASDMARRKFGDAPFNQFIYEEFEKFVPSTAHLALVQLPWNCVYSTNYDLLVEHGARQMGNKAAGDFKAIFSANTDIATLVDADIPYYKIHGSIDFANTYEGRLIITREDYRTYESNRNVLFSRLRNDLLSKTFVFIGYGFKDDNLRTVLDEVRDALGTQSFPASFAIRKGFSESEVDYWKDKYNLQLIDADASEFLVALRDTWDAERHSASGNTWSNPGIEHSETAKYTFPQVGVSFYRLIPEACVGSSNPGLFFKGGTCSWADIRDKVPPKRDQYWTLLESLFADFTDPALPASTYLVTGPAGTGKTTLCRTIAFDVAKDLGLPVLLHIPGTPLDARSLGSITDVNNLKRIVVCIRDGAMYADELETFFADLKRLRLPVSVLIEERKNEWSVAAHRAARRVAPIEIELGSISEDEIEQIIDGLARFNCLGKLKGLAREHQRAHFASIADKELLVALRELTSDANFDEIIKDEYASVPSELAKKAYLYVAAIGQANVPLRFEHLIRLLNIRFDQLGSEILRPTDRILIDGDQYGASRHNAGFSLKTRHPVIASVIFSTAAPDDESRYQVLREIVTQLDPGFREDKRLLEELVRREEILATIADPERKRAIFDIIARMLPRNPFVLQHRSMLERALGSAESSVKFARQALELEPHNPSIKNTLGLSLVMTARESGDSLKRQAYLIQAKKIFEEGIQKDSANPYSYVGMAHVMRTEAESTIGPEKVLLQAGILTMLEDAYETTAKSEIIAGQLAEQQRNIGETEDALKLVVEALKTKETDTRLRILEARLRLANGDVPGALNAALTGLKFDPNAWRLNHLAARLLRKKNGADSAIRGHYEAARRHQKGDLQLAVEYGAFLFTRGYRPRASEIFNEAQNLPIPAADKRVYREWWRVDEESKQSRVFSGVVKTTKGVTATLIATPENFEAICWQTQVGPEQLRVGDKVKFAVAFSAFGAQARITRPNP